MSSTPRAEAEPAFPDRFKSSPAINQALTINLLKVRRSLNFPRVWPGEHSAHRAFLFHKAKGPPEAVLDPGGRGGAPVMSLLHFVGIRLLHDRRVLLFVLLLLVVFVVIIIVVGIARWHRVHDGFKASAASRSSSQGLLFHCQ